MSLNPLFRLYNPTDISQRINRKKPERKQSMDSLNIFGKGLFGDRTFILDEYRDPTYAHNLILELLVDFGLVFGTLIAQFVLFLIIKALIVSIKSKNLLLIKMSFAMISVLFVKHMISASFLTSFDFWFYIGLSVHIVIFNTAKLNSEVHNL